MGSQQSQQKENKNIKSNTAPLQCSYKDYRSVLVHRYCNVEILHHTYACTNFHFFSKIPMAVMTLITSYVPLLYQIYKISKTRIDCKPLSHSHDASPSPSISSVSITSLPSNCSLSPKYTNQMERLYEWESMLYSTENIYHCASKYFIKAANKQIYGIGHNENVSLGTNILLMSNGICAGNIAIKYENGYIYTSKIRGQSFNKFASLQHVNIIQIECGKNHSLFLSMDGRVYSMGNNDYGQCGIGDMQVNPNQIAAITAFIEKKCFITSISCGSQHSSCIDIIKHKLYCFGANKYNQCSSEQNEMVNTPKIYSCSHKINEKTNIIKAECGKYFTACLTAKGYFYGFGRAKWIMKSKNHKDDLMQNGVWFNTNRVLYRDFSVGFDHIILITKFGRIVTFGYTFDKFDSDLRVIGITDSFFEIDKKNFDELNDFAQIHKVIAGKDDCVFIFKSEQ